MTVSIEELWDRAAGRESSPFDPAEIAHQPEPVRRYFEHAIAPGTSLASAVKLEMKGHIKLNNWVEFEAEQVIDWEHGLIWKASAHMPMGITITGSDRIIDGEGAMRWKVFGVIPMMSKDGPDISRSAAGRLEIESIWLPSVLLAEDVNWTVLDDDWIRAHVHVLDFENDLDLRIDENGRVLEASISRWGNPEGAAFREERFGAYLGAETTFGGYTIPSTLSVGWYFGTERFAADGEFFRAQVLGAKFR